MRPGARGTGVRGMIGGAVKLDVQVAPEGGRANQAVVELLAGLLGVAKRDVAVVHGHTSRDKVVEVIGVDDAQARRRLEQAMDDDD